MNKQFENGEVSTSNQKNSVPIKVYKWTANPNKSWDEISVKQNQLVLEPPPNNLPVYEDKVRFVCMSDTHSRTNRFPADFIPPGDVFLHAGDFSMIGKMNEIEEFNKFLGTLPHKHKIVIAGNHDLTFDKDMSDLNLQFFGHITGDVSKYFKENSLDKASDLLTNCTYLEDSEAVVAGIRIYGSPWQPEFGGWGFNLDRGKPLLDKWKLIPDGIDVLMTHGPPIGYGDLCRSWARAGCVELLNTIQKRVKPKYHIFGHIHEAYGMTSDGYTTYINASTCTLRYRPDNQPIIFDIPLPYGCRKDDIVIKPNSNKQTNTNKPDTTQNDSNKQTNTTKPDTSLYDWSSGNSSDSFDFVFQDTAAENISGCDQATSNEPKL